MYLPSTTLYARWLHYRLVGKSDAEAWECVRDEQRLRPRDYARTSVAGGGNQPPILLSVPILGGASVTKKGRVGEWKVSLHGRWPAIHTGALEAAYSTTPYYSHLISGIAPILKNIEEGTPFLTFTSALHESISDFMDIESLLPQLRDVTGDNKKIPQAWIEASGNDTIRTGFNPEISFIEPLFRHGRAAIFTLLAMLSLLFCFVVPADAKSPSDKTQVNKTQVISHTDTPKLNIKVYEGFQRFVDEYGDTVRMTYIRELVVYPPMKFKNKKEEDFYWRTVRDVRKTLPYAKLCYATLCETYEYIQTIPDPKKREQHLKQLEKDIFERYKPVFKSMTKGQGKILLKLINRETDQSSYHIVKAFLGTFRAGFWQTFGRFFGMNLKSDFNPKKNKEDATIDRIATLIEQGAL